jgi:tape measure domain-containing protein
MARTIHAVDVEIEGHLDPSLAKAVGLTEAQFKRLQSAAATFNSITAKMGEQMPRQFQVAADRINRAMNSIESKSGSMSRRMGENFKKAAEQAREAGEKITKNLAGAFDKISEKAMHLTGIGGLISTVGAAFAGEEFVRGSWEVRAERGVLQNQLRSVTESQGKGGLAEQVDTLLRNMEGRETAVRYEPLLETTNMMLAAAPERFKNVDQIHKMLGQLADVSRTPEAFGMVSSAFTKILAEGKVDAQHLNEMSIDTGFAFRKAMADTLKVTPEQLSEMLKKHKLTGDQQINALMGAFGLITGPGGAAYKHAEAQLTGLAGIQERFLGHWRDFQESFGKQLENFITPIAERVFAVLTPAALTHAFDGLSNFVKSIGGAIGMMVDKLQQGRAAEQIKMISGALGSFATKMTGGAGFGSFFKQVEDPVSGVHDVLTATGEKFEDMLSSKWVDNIATALSAIRTTVQFIADHFTLIKNTLIGLVGAMAAAKLIETASTIGGAAWGLGKAIWSLGKGVVNMATGVVNVNKGPEGILDNAKKILPLTPVGLSALAGLGFTWGVSKGADVVGDLIQKKFFPDLGKGQTVNSERYKTAFAAREEAAASGARPEKLARMDDGLSKLYSTLSDSEKAAVNAASAQSTLASSTNSAIGAVNGLSAALRALQVPNLAVPGVSPNVPPRTIAKPHALGGLFTRPHIGLVAEKWPELITPLGGPNKGLGLGGHTFQIHSAPVINVGSGTDLGSIKAALEEHARSLAREVRKIIEIDLEREAVV